MKFFSYISFLTLLLTILLFAQSNPAIHANQPAPLAGVPKLHIGAATPFTPDSQALPVHFARAVVYDSGGYDTASIAVGDVNGDGYPDLVVASMCPSGMTCGSGGVLSVLLGNGDGTFQSAVSYSSGGFFASSVAIGDVNGDGKLDLVVANQSSYGSGNGAVGVLLGNGDGTFQPPVSYSSGGFAADSITVGDVNGDGHPDLVVANDCQSSSDCSQFVGPGAVSVLLGNGDGTFQTPVSYSSGGASAGPVAIGDVNGDGHPDLAVVNEYLSEFDRSAGNVSVLLNNGDGTFQPPVSYPVGYGPGSVAIGDLNGDGHPDLVVANQSLNGYGAVGVLLGNGDGTFQNPVNYTSGGVWADAVAIGDLNGDGNPDLAVTNMCAIGGTGKCLRPTVFVLPGSGDGTFVGQYTARSLGGYDPQSIAIADVNGDGKPDLVVANFAAYGNHAHGSVGVLLNDLAAKTLTNLTSSLNPSQVNQPVTFTATITSALPIPDGEVVAFYDGATELGTDSTTNGVATLTTSFSKAGGHTIKATYPGDAFHKGSSGKARQVVKR